MKEKKMGSSKHMCHPQYRKKTDNELCISVTKGTKNEERVLSFHDKNTSEKNEKSDTVLREREREEKKENYTFASSLLEKSQRKVE